MKTCSLLAVLACVVLEGCATSLTKAETRDGQGGVQILVQKDLTPPFAKKNEAIGTMRTSLTKDGAYEVSTGQSAKGIDNTGQAAVVSGIVEGLTKGFLGWLSSRPAPTAAASSSEPGVMDFIDSLLQPKPVGAK